jgi:hypothetical protein
MYECGISIEKRIDFKESGKGCCHDSVEKICDNLFEKDSLKVLVSSFDSQSLKDWKKNLTSQVSLQCMENKMTHQEIRVELLRLISDKVCLSIN